MFEWADAVTKRAAEGKRFHCIPDNANDNTIIHIISDAECGGLLGCVILPKVLELISDVDFSIPLPMNKSPSEKKSNRFHF